MTASFWVASGKLLQDTDQSHPTFKASAAYWTLGILKRPQEVGCMAEVTG